MNNYCDKCKNHYLLDGDESRCRVISLGMSSAKCVQVKECDSDWITWAKENISREPVKSLLAQM